MIINAIFFPGKEINCDISYFQERINRARSKEKNFKFDNGTV